MQRELHFDLKEFTQRSVYVESSENIEQFEVIEEIPKLPDLAAHSTLQLRFFLVSSALTTRFSSAITGEAES